MRRDVGSWLFALLWITALLQPFTTAIAQAPSDEAAHVYFLLAIDTVTPNAKALGLDLDRDNFAAAIRGAMKSLGYKEGPGGRYSIRILQDGEMSEKMVLDYFRKLKASPQDTLVFYYTGHGGFYPEKGHLLAMRNYYDLKTGRQTKYAVVDRKELLAAMARHNPRAMIVLTDCCASTQLPLVPGGDKKTPPDMNRKPVLNGNGQGELLRDLFFKSRGVVNITAARTGTAAEGRRNEGGSHFTVALWKLLKEKPQPFDRDKNGVVEWKEFFPALENLTEQESFHYLKNAKGDYLSNRNGEKLYTFHTPEAFTLGEPIRKTKGLALAKGKPALLDVDDNLASHDRTYNKGANLHYIKDFPLPMKRDKAYLVSLHSSNFDTFLFVKDTQHKTLAFNDDYGHTTTRSRVLFYPPADGTYLVGVSSYGPEETGRFSLTVQESTAVDQLTTADRLDRFCLGAHAKVHPVQLAAFRSYTIQLESDDFDPYLRVEDEYGNTIALNDDEDESQGRLNSMLSLRTYSNGTYYIVATTYQKARTGRYAVFVQE